MKDVTCATYPARLPQVKANYFREKILEVLRVIAVLRVHVLRILRVPGSILRFSTCTADTARLAVFRGSLLHQLWILPVLQNISGFCIAGIAGTASTRVLGVPKYSEHEQYTGSVKYISTVCAPFQ